MSPLITSTKRFVGLLATTIMLAALIGSAAAQAGTYEGEAAVLGYHEGGTNYTQIAFLPPYSNEKWHWSTNTPPRSGSGTSPSVWVLCAHCAEEPIYNAALNAENANVWDRMWTGSLNWEDLPWNYSPRTSPVMNGTTIAWHSTQENHLYLNTGNTGLGMEPETSPAMVNCNVGGACQIAFAAAGTNHLYMDAGAVWDTNLGMAPKTSPSIVASGGTVYVAFNAAGTNHLWIYNASTRTTVDTGLGMNSTSSPSLAVWPKGGYLVAFQASNNHLGLYQNGASSWNDYGKLMQSGSSPSLTVRGNGSSQPGHWDVAYQAASTHHLWTLSETAGAVDSGQVMGELTSPSFSGGYGLEE